jgi:hypothetical protein
MTFSAPYNFIYFGQPVNDLTLISASATTVETTALIDTGADVSLFDELLAQTLGLSLDGSPEVRIGGIGGSILARMQSIEIRLFHRPDLVAILEVGFVVDAEASFGNILGLDAVSFFDFALSHASRSGYLGRTS